MSRNLYDVSKAERIIRLDPHKLDDLYHNTQNEIEKTKYDIEKSTLLLHHYREETAYIKEVIGSSFGESRHNYENLMDFFVKKLSNIQNMKNKKKQLENLLCSTKKEKVKATDLQCQLRFQKEENEDPFHTNMEKRNVADKSNDDLILKLNDSCQNLQNSTPFLYIGPVKSFRKEESVRSNEPQPNEISSSSESQNNNVHVNKKKTEINNTQRKFQGKQKEKMISALLQSLEKAYKESDEYQNRIMNARKQKVRQQQWEKMKQKELFLKRRKAAVEDRLNKISKAGSWFQTALTSIKEEKKLNKENSVGNKGDTTLQKESIPIVTEAIDTNFDEDKPIYNEEYFQEENKLNGNFLSTKMRDESKSDDDQDLKVSIEDTKPEDGQQSMIDGSVNVWTAEELAQIFEMDWCVRLLKDRDFLNNLPNVVTIKE